MARAGNNTAGLELYLQRSVSVQQPFIIIAGMKIVFDYNFITGNQEIHFNLSTVFPFIFNVATIEQAAAIAAVVESKFYSPVV